MELITLTISGFKRFREKTNVKLKGKMTAIVGPNEAGKSSLLEAINQLDDDDAIPKSYISRGDSGNDTRIVGRYFLNDFELDQCNLTQPSWLTVTKKQSGARKFAISPSPPDRDIKDRKKLLEQVSQAFRNPKMRRKLDALDDAERGELHTQLSSLQSYEPDLSPDQQGELENFAAEVKKLIDDSDSKYIVELVEQFDQVIELEEMKNPQEYALEELERLFPRILFFDQRSRDLKSNYNLEELAASKIDDALGNLCDVAKIELKSLQDALNDPDPSSAMRTILNAANRELRSIYDEAWGQSGVSVSINFHNDSLDIQVENKDGRLTPLAERSDGLRQFVALQSFSHAAWKKDTVLLIDEAEQKLHYDAQADLVQMLAKQQVAAKVIHYPLSWLPS